MVFSPVYVDALVLRDRDTDSNGTLDERLWVQQDANFNVTALLDNSGAVVERYVYDPYGAATVLTPTWGTRTETLYAWVNFHQGGRFEGTIGQYDFRYRPLSPTLMRWAQLDPIGLGASNLNLYGYVGNNSIRKTDPLGLSYWDQIFTYSGPESAKSGQTQLWVFESKPYLSFEQVRGRGRDFCRSSGTWSQPFWAGEGGAVRLTERRYKYSAIRGFVLIKGAPGRFERGGVCNTISNPDDSSDYRMQVVSEFVPIISRQALTK